MELNRDVLTEMIASMLVHFDAMVKSKITNEVLCPPCAEQCRNAYQNDIIIKSFTDKLVDIFVSDHWGADPAKWAAIYIAANKVLMQVGYEGNIESDNPAV